MVILLDLAAACARFLSNTLFSSSTGTWLAQLTMQAGECRRLARQIRWIIVLL